jgi:[acyl-carrier-protein] S-malonyltransferase
MGSMMKKEIIGGQIIYPITNEDWTYDLKQKEFVLDLIKECVQTQNGEAYVSIHLGGYLVIGGDHKGLSWLLKKLPQKEHFPFQLLNHAAFHTPLLKGTSELAFQMISPEIFRSPKIPMIDGRGHIWQPYSSDPLDIYTYTLGHQVCEVYDYSVSITVGLKEFAPDAIILLGPGNTLGGTTGQILVNSTWRGIKSKESFQSLQKTNPFIVSMGL